MSIILQLRAKHFVDTDFGSASDCAMAKAAKEQLRAKEVSASTTFVYVDNQAFYKADYDFGDFVEDKEMARTISDPEQIVRSIRLIERQ